MGLKKEYELEKIKEKYDIDNWDTEPIISEMCEKVWNKAQETLIEQTIIVAKKDSDLGEVLLEKLSKILKD